MLDPLSLWLILLPLGVAVVNIFLPTLLRKLLTALSLGVSLYLVVDLYFISGLAHLQNAEFMLWGEQILAIDQMSAFSLAFIQLLSFIILLFSLKGVQVDIQKPFFILFPFTVAACNGVVLSVHGISFMMFWGVSGIALFLFALLGRTKESSQTAFKSIMLIGGSDALLVLGFAVFYVMQTQSGWSLTGAPIPLTGGMAYLSFVLLGIAAFAKAGGFPFHTWLPDFAKDAPVESAALLPASLDKLIGIYLLARMFTTLFTVNMLTHLVVFTLGALTVIIAVMMAMNQHNGRRLLGYHAVSQVGYMIMGVAGGSVLAFAGGLFHLVNNTIYKSSLFLTLGSVEKQTGTNDLDDLGGLARNMPITFLMALIGALSISGIPPFNGFFSKWMIYQGVLEWARDAAPGYQLWILVCLVLAIFGSALTLASFMKFLHAIYLGKQQEKFKDIKEAPANQWLATGLLSVLCVVFGLFGAIVPLKLFIFPAMQDVGLTGPAFIGDYQPVMLFVMFFIAFALGMVIYAATRKVRFDNVYLGGMSPLEKFRVSGTAFYNEIRTMRGLKGIYDAADKHAFDAHDIGEKSTLAFGRVFQGAHTGLLQLYVLFIVAGAAIVLLIL